MSLYTGTSMWHDTLLNAHPVQIRRGEASAMAASALWQALMALTRLTWGFCPWVSPGLHWSSSLCPASLPGCVVGCCVCVKVPSPALNLSHGLAFWLDLWPALPAHVHLIIWTLSALVVLPHLPRSSTVGLGPVWWGTSPVPMCLCSAACPTGSPGCSLTASVVVAPKIHLWSHKNGQQRSPVFQSP